MANKKANGNGHVRGLYRAYRFTEKDPAIAELMGVAEQYYGTRITGRQLADITDEGGPAASTMRAWFYGETKRPTNATMEAAGRAMGFQRVWKKMRRNAPE